VSVCLVDTGILYAMFDRSDRWHARALAFVNGYRGRLLVAACAVPEAAYLVNKYLGVSAEMELVHALAHGDFDIEDLAKKDYGRAATLIAQYEKLNIGFVDAASVALCERLKITDFATTDWRHFSVIQTAQRRTLNLLPAD